jgi:hypothetical protein
MSWVTRLLPLDAVPLAQPLLQCKMLMRDEECRKQAGDEMKSKSRLVSQTEFIGPKSLKT